MNTIKLSELIEAVEFEADESTCYVDLLNGCVVRLPNSLLSAVEEEDEAALGRLADWEKEELEVARAIVSDSGERFLAPPGKFDFHEYRQMERFIGTVENVESAEQLWGAIKGKGAFRYFKDTAARLGLLDRWYRYRESALKAFVIEWAEANHVPFVDDVVDRAE